MNNRPVIGITVGIETDANNRDKAVLNAAYIRAVQHAGGIPVIIPAEPETKTQIAEYLKRVDALLLPGGGDVDPILFGEEGIPELGDVDRTLDDVEILMTRSAAELGMPVFGICRGVQVINVAFGGTLYQDIPAQYPAALCHRQKEGRSVKTHAVTVRQGSSLNGPFPNGRFASNSFHHQAVKRVADGFEVSAVADDGIIEGIEDRTRRISGVQFHPECLWQEDEGYAELFRMFINDAVLYAAGKLPEQAL